MLEQNAIEEYRKLLEKKYGGPISLQDATARAEAFYKPYRAVYFKGHDADSTEEDNKNKPHE